MAHNPSLVTNWRFSSIGAVKVGWQSFKNDPGFLVGTVILAWLVPAVIWASMPGWFLSETLSFLASIICAMGVIDISLKMQRRQHVSFGDLFGNYRLIVRAVISSIAMGLATAIPIVGLAFMAVIVGIMMGAGDPFIGTMIAIVLIFFLSFPFFVILARLQYYLYLIVDKDLGALDAIRKSWDLTQGQAWPVVMMFNWFTLLVILGVCALGVGLLVAVPVCIMANAYAYQQMLDRSDMANLPARSR